MFFFFLLFSFSLVWLLDSEGYRLRGECYAMMNQAEKALSDLNEAIHLDPSNDPAYSSRGIVNARLGQTDTALEDLRRGHTPLQDAYCAVGCVLVEQKKLHDAENMFKRALAIDPNHEQSRDALKVSSFFSLVYFIVIYCCWGGGEGFGWWWK